jgi:uncharacterized protein with HEPN domain
LKAIWVTAKKFDEYDVNFLIQDAVERNLITIGEAMNRLLVLLPENPNHKLQKSGGCS